jgi:hypothetical protein
MNWKETYTKIFLKQAGKGVNEVSFKEYYSTWWQNTRSKEEGGLRLTDEGYLFVTETLDIQTYEVPFPKDFELTTQTIIWLDRFISCPYWLGRDSIIVTDEKKALELHLFSGDIRKYGLTKAMKRHDTE